MAQIITMPQPGSTMEEGTIVRWFVQEGEPIGKGAPLLEIETDKATVEVESPIDGVLRKILAPANTIVPVREAIAILGQAEESIEALLAELGVGTQNSGASLLQDTTSGVSNGIEVHSSTTAANDTVTIASRETDSTPARVFASPRARKLAGEQGVPLAALVGKGTGPDTRVIERDVLAYLANPGLQRSPSPIFTPSNRTTPLAARIADELGIDLNDLAAGLPGSRVRREDVLRHVENARPIVETSPPLTTSAVSNGSGPVSPAGSDAAPSSASTLPFSGMRRRIADNVSKSAFSAPHVTLTLEVDMTAAAEFRSRLLPDVEKIYGARLAYNDILIKAVALALGTHPLLNAALVGEEIRLHTEKNIGVAVALEEGLIVPVIKNADKKSLGAVSAEFKQLVERAKSGKFTPDDLSGGTFTITNLGGFGIDSFDPIIVPPQSAILGVGRIADKPVVINKDIVVRAMMNLCLSFDHRVLDGTPAARFLQRVKELLETPMSILI